LQAIDDNKIDMIVAGALEKEVVLRPFSAMSRVGSCAKRNVRHAFYQAGTEPRPLRRIVFMADYSDTRNAPSIHLASAEAEECEKLYTIRVYTTFDEARAAIFGRE